jgi:hypothetical protein
MFVPIMIYGFVVIIMLVVVSRGIVQIIKSLSEIDLFIWWSVEGIIAVFIHALPVLTFYSFPVILIYVHEYITRDRPVDVVPLTWEEQKEMGQLHHCKVYQKDCFSRDVGKNYSCDTSNM